MKIGIVGTGNMGRILGCGWAVAGHEVLFGARDLQAASRAAGLAQTQGAASAFAGSNDEAAAFGDVVFYGVRNVDPAQVLANTALLDGKVVIDPNNWPVPEGRFEFTPVTQSLAEKLQAWLPRAHVVKAFNTMAQELFEMPVADLRQRGVTAFIATDHSGARDAACDLARDLGLHPVDMGPLRNARIVEPLGDVIRYLILGAGLGPYATLNVDVLDPAPAGQAGRFGGRSASTWWARNAQRS